MMQADIDPFVPQEAEIVERIQESPSIYTLNLRLSDPQAHQNYRFAPGQFNMIYLYGVGEVAISIVSDPNESRVLRHTIRAVGRVTNALQNLQTGDRVGIRGPFGRGWPVDQAQGKDVIVITGGLGCAPSVSIINYIMKRRADYARLNILQGVKHSDDFIFRKKYDQWRRAPQTRVLIAADEAAPGWPWNIGYVTDMLDKIEYDKKNAIAMMCGPEIMMGNAVKLLRRQGLAEEAMYLSMERNMECGLGLCGHCQYGGFFICKDGPVFSFPQIKPLFDKKGF